MLPESILYVIFFCFLPLFLPILYIWLLWILCSIVPQQGTFGGTSEQLFVPLANGEWGMDPITVGGLLLSRLSRWSSRRPIPTITVTNTHNNRINKNLWNTAYVICLQYQIRIQMMATIRYLSVILHSTIFLWGFFFLL